MPDSSGTPTPTDLAHDLNRARVEIRVELQTAKDELRREFTWAMASQRELLITGGVARHEKASLRIDAVSDALQTFEDNLNRMPTQLDREVSRLTTLFDEKLAAAHIKIKAVEDTGRVLEDNITRVPTQLDREMSRLKELFDEKGRAIDARLQERDARRIQDKDASAASVMAALASLRELTEVQNKANLAAAAKSDAGVTKDLDGIRETIKGISNTFDTKITNLTDRLNRGEGMDSGAREAKVAGNVTNTTITGYIIGAAGVLAVLVSLFGIFHQPAGNPTVGADTKRVDDLIAARSAETTQRIADQAAMIARLDALSGRLNALASTLSPPPAPAR